MDLTWYYITCTVAAFLALYLLLDYDEGGEDD